MTFSEKQLTILNVAERLFCSRGYDSVSVKQIADAAGITSGLVFYYFTSKESLLESIFHWRIGQLQDKVQAVLENTVTDLQRKLQVLMDACIELGFSNPMALSRCAPMIENLICTGKDRGRVKEQADVLFITDLMLGTITQAVINKEDYKECSTHPIHDEQAQRMALTGALNTFLKNILQSIMIYE